MYYGLRGDGWEDVSHEGHGQVRGMTTDEEPQLAIEAGDGDMYRECPDCGAYIEEDAEDIRVALEDDDDPDEYVPIVEGHEDDCGQREWRAEESIGMHFNGAGVIVREDAHRSEVQVWISVGDPRGAFCMTLELVNVGDHKGELRLSVPQPGEGMGHMDLTELNGRGYYRIGS